MTRTSSPKAFTPIRSTGEGVTINLAGREPNGYSLARSKSAIRLGPISRLRPVLVGMTMRACRICDVSLGRGHFLLV